MILQLHFSATAQKPTHTQSDLRTEGGKEQRGVWGRAAGRGNITMKTRSFITSNFEAAPDG